MKLRTALLLCLLAPLAHAEEPRNIVLADLGLHVVGLGYQRTLTEQVALQVSFNLYVPWTQNMNALGLSGTADLGDVTGLIARARVFVYPKAHAPTGFWMSPYGQAGIGMETRDGQKQQGIVWAIGAAAGWGWLVKNHLHLALGLGVQYHAAKFPRGPGFGRFFPTFDANLGWAF